MTVELPQFVGWGGGPAGFHLLELATGSLRGSIGPGGTLALAFPIVDADRQWQITRAAISCTGTTNPQPKLRGYVVPDGQVITSQGVDARYLRTGTDVGLFDEADYPADGLVVSENEQLLWVWTGGTFGEIAVASIQYRLLGR